MPRIEINIPDDALAALLAQDTSRTWRVPPAERAIRLSPEELAALRPHVINLTGGKFRKAGNFYTTKADVDAIFRQHLPAWEAAHKASGRPCRIVFYAHGGLKNEGDGLEIAARHVGWWKKNDVYPIHFVWETGLFDAMRAVLQDAASRIPGWGARGLISRVSDPWIEAGCRTLGGVKAWSAMKSNAVLANAAGGGGTYTAEQLAAYCKAQDGKPLEVHAVGHSAGAIFHSFFVPLALQQGVPSFKTVQFLAPAVRIDDFKDLLFKLIGRGVEQFTTFNLAREHEEADDCIGIYSKSLLYLIHHALEPTQEVPLLGLDMSVRGDPVISELFGLNGRSYKPAQVIWSRTVEDSGRHASRALHHGDFDDDRATMGSVAARVLGLDNPLVPFEAPRSRELGAWPVSSDWLARFDLPAVPTPFEALAQAAAQPVHETAPKIAAPVTVKANGHRRRALCVGIDAYPGAEALSGCVNDARGWSSALARAGFDVTTLLDGESTYDGITRALDALVKGAGDGDVLVFHYSGHGTTVADDDGEEKTRQDQAFVPVDFGDGAFLIDDEVGRILDRLPPGAQMTVFADCCHSATITRALTSRLTAPPRNSKPRRMIPTRDQLNAYRRFRTDLRSRRFASRDTDESHAIKWINFSACKENELAYENDGHGAFTRIVLGLLGQDLRGVSNGLFQQRIETAFGANPPQTPYLHCGMGTRSLPVLGGVTATM